MRTNRLNQAKTLALATLAAGGLALVAPPVAADGAQSSQPYTGRQVKNENLFEVLGASRGEGGFVVRGDRPEVDRDIEEQERPAGERQAELTRERLDELRRGLI